MVLQSAPSWDLVITLMFVIGVTYGFIMMRDRILVMLLALYAGNVVANAIAEPIHKFFNGDVAILNKIWVSSNASPFFIKLAVFGAVVLLISAKGGLSGKRSGVSFFELGAYSFFSVCIGLSSLFSFMEPAKVAEYTSASKLAALVVNHQTLWFVAPLVVLAVLGGGHRSASRYADDY